MRQPPRHRLTTKVTTNGLDCVGRNGLDGTAKTFDSEVLDSAGHRRTRPKLIPNPGVPRSNRGGGIEFTAMTVERSPDEDGVAGASETGGS